MRQALEGPRGMGMAGLVALWLLTSGSALADGNKPARILRLSWDREILTIRGEHLPGGAVEVLYIEAYCRPGSTRRDWKQTVIPHKTERVEAAADGSLIRLRSRLDDGVVIDHEIRAGRDEVDFRVMASNPTGKASEVDWAQPCIRVNRYAGVPYEPSSEAYLPRCFIFVGGRPVRMPTTPWAREAVYTPGQVWCPAGISYDDVNPRPLSPIVPSNGLIGCVSADGKELLATAWEPYQELFQGVIVCLHSDFRIGGLAPGQSRTIRGKIYLMPADIPALLERYHHDFPGQESRSTPDATSEPARKLIEFGWDEPGTSFLRAHLAEMERTPFDGCVFHVDARSPAGAPASLTWQGWGKKMFRAEDVTAGRRDLETVAASATHFRHNFLRFNTTPADLDWFDDHASVIANARLAAELARAGRARGILLDTEQYEGKLFDYRRQREASRHSWAEYAAQARRRGREVMTAMQEGYPGLTVFLTFGDSLVWNQSDRGKKPLAECSYGLLVPFLDGLIDAARDGTRIVDGHEPSYGYREASAFIEARRTILRDAAALAADRTAYAKRVSAGFGLWLDYDWRKLGWNTGDPSKNHFTPQGFETALRAALEQSDDYVWIYTETPRWWSKKGGTIALPSTYVDAGRRARRALAGDEPPRGEVKPAATPSGAPTGTTSRGPIEPPYGAGQGPGITIAVGGSFRLYLDGELLVEESAAGKPRFVPMSFLPGRHVVAVEANRARERTPGILVQVDELEKTYVSGPGWKTASTPADAWKSPSYHDDGWQPAAVVADLSARPVAGLPAAALASSAQWIWSPRLDDERVALRWTFTIQAEGFGRETTGGARGKRVVATSADEIIRLATQPGPLTILIPEGVYDFRRRRKTIACANPNDPQDPSKGVTYRIPVGKNDFGCEPGAKKVAVDRWERVIRLASDKTLVGMGRGAYLRAASFYLRRPHRNVILRNLCIYDVNPHLVEARDGIEALDASDLWVDHCTFRWISDGNDMTGKEGVRGVTFSWVHYNGANQFVYRGQDHYAALLHNAEITYHHVWWDKVAGRAPKATGAGCRVHVYNNLHTHNPYFAIAADDGAQVLVEASQFRDIRFPTEREDGSIDSRGNVYRDITAGHRVNGKPAEEPKDPVFTPPYAYSADPVESVPELLRRRSGVGGPWGLGPEY